MAEVDHSRPHGEPPTGARPAHGPRPPQRTYGVPSHPPPLPTPPAGRQPQWTSAPADLTERRGLLEPRAPKRGTPGSEGAPVQQCAGATRLLGGRCAAGGGRPRAAGAPAGGEGVRVPAGEE